MEDMQMTSAKYQPASVPMKDEPPVKLAQRGLKINESQINTIALRRGNIDIDVTPT